jgi:uncharacterized protein
MRFSIVIACAAALALAGGCKGGTSEALASQSTKLAQLPLKIVSAGGKTHDFTVEVASTADEQQRGLMFRESLAPNGGMLFPMNPARPANFWMKDTVISLDMIFIRKDGTIARIASETVPYSLEQVESGEPVGAVLEIGAGRAAQLGIQENDKVSW